MRNRGRHVQLKKDGAEAYAQGETREDDEALDLFGLKPKTNAERQASTHKAEDVVQDDSRQILGDIAVDGASQQTKCQQNGEDGNGAVKLSLIFQSVHKTTS